MVENYYTSRRDSLIKDFDRASRILEQVLTARYGAQFASTIRKEVRQERGEQEGRAAPDGSAPVYCPLLVERRADPKRQHA